MDAQSVIEKFKMRPHPEGGWYVETHRDCGDEGGRGAVTAIYFLLEAGQRSHWHRVDATEIWLWHAGAPLQLDIAADAGTTDLHNVTLGPDVAAGQAPQGVVPKATWQSAESLGDWTLVSCVVAPAFDFAGFELAPPGWAPGGS
ncbi:MAG: cupin domain-containing protein [Geminicoccaceae bacterium]